MVQSQRVTDFAAPLATDFQPEPWQILQTVDEEVTEEILKKIIGWWSDCTMRKGAGQVNSPIHPIIRSFRCFVWRVFLSLPGLSNLTTLCIPTQGQVREFHKR